MSNKIDNILYPSEFNAKESIQSTIAIKELGPKGHMISSSKGRYRYDNPTNFVVFNANLFISQPVEKIWYGDVDLTLDSEKIKRISSLLKTNVLVLSEMDGRFDKETNSNPSEDALVTYTPNGSIKLRFSKEPFYYLDESNILRQYSDEEWAIRYPQPEIQERNWLEDKKDEFTTINFPFVDTFTSKSKRQSPIDLLHKYFLSQNNNDLEQASQALCDTYWTTEYNDAFRNILEDWGKKVLKLDGYDLEKALAWSVFDMPSNLGFKTNPTWAISGAVYKRTKNK